MPSERIQRQIDRLLDEADEAIASQDWTIVRDRARSALRLDPENQDAYGPMFIGKDSEGEDVFVVCFELRRPIDGELVKTHQWHAFVTEGRVEIERPNGPDQDVKIDSDDD